MAAVRFTHIRSIRGEKTGGLEVGENFLAFPSRAWILPISFLIKHTQYNQLQDNCASTKAGPSVSFCILLVTIIINTSQSSCWSIVSSLQKFLLHLRSQRQQRRMSLQQLHPWLHSYPITSRKIIALI